MSSQLDPKAHCSEALTFSWARSEALERLGGDEHLLDKVIELFLVESPKLVLKMRHALSCRDHTALESAAHSLKGQLGYMALPTCESQILEDAGRTGELRDAEDALARLQIRLAEVWSLLSKKPGA
jgi:two-component system, sensor histidine kinase and response regulator